MDRRIKYTKKAIKDAFLSLLKEKEISKISVSEICKLSDINRATFYRYYLDVLDLRDKIKDEFILELVVATENQDNMTVSEFTYEILKVFLNNKELVKLIFNNSNESLGNVNEILEVAYLKCEARWTNDIRKELTTEDIEFAFVFIFNGALGIVNYWIKNDFNEDIEIIAKNVEELSYYGIKKFLYQK